MKLTLGFSPCPNDTFIFDALVNNKIETEGMEFDVLLEDVQTLNEWATEGKLDITKLSYGVLPLALDSYLLLNSGSALGRGAGPLLITKDHSNDLLADIVDVETKRIAIPGKFTTAHLLFSLAFPHANNKVFMRYDEIEHFVLQGKGLGVIIHENRFTYAEKGLKKITDLGDYWEKETSHPVPLGGIVAKRSMNKTLILEIDRLIRQSIEYAFRYHHDELTDYVKNHSQEMSDAVMRKHIDLYVNDFSIDLGEEGRKAVKKLFEVFKRTYPSISFPEQVFVDEFNP
jgi:1,4-dihydroxy-6-naphthoate synthase